MIPEHEAMIHELHLLWHEASKICSRALHDGKTLILDYTHVQMVHICSDCYEQTAEKHNEIAKRYGVA